MSVTATAGKNELEKWNWGAFFWTWIWAIGRGKAGQGLLWLLVSLIVPIVPNVYFGLRGNKLAWETGRFETYGELRASERKWARAALIACGALVALTMLIVLFWL